jgi:hypothetical protein
VSFGGGVAGTIVNPVVLVVVLMAGVLICILPRSKAVIPFIAAGILIPIDQIVVVAGLHFPMLRVLALFGFVRMFLAKLSGQDKIFSGGMNGIDKALIVLALFTTFDGVLLWRAWGEVIFQLGNLYTAFGVYFLLRYLIRDEEDVKRALRVLACVTVVVAGFMTYEHITGHNLFYAILGGARSAVLASADERADAFRAAGCFAHPIIAGTFGGFMAPLFVGWWRKERRDRKFAGPGAVAATVIPFAVGSSTALFALIAGIGALCLWPLRRQMRILRWSLVVVLVSLHIVMKAPVWQLIARVHLAGGSSSYHRYELVNQCILHFWDWALVGTKDFGSWGWVMWDLANQYVATADTAGLIPLIAFLAILVYGFKYVGRARRYYEGDRPREFFVWAIGGSLFANVVGFFGIGYWDQIIVPWYGLLAVISVLSLAAKVPKEDCEPLAIGKAGLGVHFSSATTPVRSYSPVRLASKRQL